MKNIFMPIRSTQTQIVKDHLLSGKTISTWQAYKLYHITCLAQCIHRLSRTGLPIASQMVVRENKRFKEYWIDEDYRQAHQVNDLKLNDGGHNDNK